MKPWVRAVIIVAVLVAVVVLVRYKQCCIVPPSQSVEEPRPAAEIPAAVSPAMEEPGETAPPAGRTLPRLVDLGAKSCIPCKMMEPVLEELTTEYEGRLQVEFIDVWKDREAGQKYGIRVIPTQVFIDASGKELFRHEGYYSKEDILGKWNELGVNLNKGADSNEPGN